MKDKIDIVIEEVSNITKIKQVKLLSKDRHREYIDARRLTYSLLRKLFKMPYVYIANYFNKNHGSVLNAVGMHPHLLKYDELYNERFHLLYDKLSEKYEKEIVTELNKK